MPRPRLFASTRILAPVLALALAALVGPGPVRGQLSGSSFTLDRYREGWSVLDRAAEALGGWDEVMALDSVTVWMHGPELDRFQSPSPEPPFRELDVELTLVADYAGSRLGSEVRVHWPDFVQHIRRVVGPSWGVVEAPGRGVRVDSTLRSEDLEGLVRRFPQHLLRSARARPAAVRYLGKRGGRDGTVEVVAVQGADDELISVYVDSASGRISGYDRLVLDWRSGDASYGLRYRDWITTGSLAHPRSIEVRQAGSLVATATVDSASAGLEAMPGLFARYDSLASDDGARSPAEELPGVRTLVRGVHLVERLAGRNYNMMFVEMGGALLAVEAPLDESTTARALEAVRSVTGDLPVRYVVPTHHHRDHAGGVRALVAAGATVLTTRGNVDLFSDVLTAVRSLAVEGRRGPGAGRVEHVDGRTHRLASGGRSVRLYDVGPNPHVDEHLVVYIPEEKVLFQGDLVQFRRAGGVEPARPHTMALLRLIEDEGLDVETIVGTHGRPGTLEDLRQAIDASAGGDE